MATITLNLHESAVILDSDPTQPDVVQYPEGTQQHEDLAQYYEGADGQTPYTEDELLVTYNAVKSLIINHGTQNVRYTIPGDGTPDSDGPYTEDADGNWVAAIGNAPQRPSAPPPAHT